MEDKSNPVHRVKINKNPIWIRANFIGEYEGIMFRFTYKEYINQEIDSLVKSFVDFKWPGRIPDNKELAEKGIKALFMKAELNYEVLEDGEEKRTEEREIDLLNELIDESIENIDDTLQER